MLKGMMEARTGSEIPMPVNDGMDLSRTIDKGPPFTYRKSLFVKRAISMSHVVFSKMVSHVSINKSPP